MIFASVQFAKMFYSLCIKPILLPSCIDSDCGNPPHPPPPKQIVPLLPLLSMLKENSLLLHRVTRWCFLSLNFSNSFILLEWAVVPSDLIVLTLEIVFQLYIWPYNNKEEASSPIIVLKTRRSLRAVHFHPHAAPFVLTAEVNYPMGV